MTLVIKIFKSIACKSLNKSRTVKNQILDESYVFHLLENIKNINFVFVVETGLRFKVGFKNSYLTGSGSVSVEWFSNEIEMKTFLESVKFFDCVSSSS